MDFKCDRDLGGPTISPLHATWGIDIRCNPYDVTDSKSRTGTTSVYVSQRTHEHKMSRLLFPQSSNAQSLRSSFPKKRKLSLPDEDGFAVDENDELISRPSTPLPDAPKFSNPRSAWTEGDIQQWVNSDFNIPQPSDSPVPSELDDGDAILNAIDVGNALIVADTQDGDNSGTIPVGGSTIREWASDSGLDSISVEEEPILPLDDDEDAEDAGRPILDDDAVEDDTVGGENYDEDSAEFTVSQTALKFAMFLSEVKISRKQWGALVEIIKSSPDDELKGLPFHKDILLDKYNRSLPLLKMHSRQIQLDVAKLPSRANHHEDLLSLDLKHTLMRMLCSNTIRRHIFRGMAHLTDEVTELWESRAWGESIRSTSGVFHKYPDSTCIFPSDFVMYQCNDLVCVICHEKTWHMGRVTWCGKDHTALAKQLGKHDEGIVLIQQVLQPTDLEKGYQRQFHDVLPLAQSDKTPEELILVEGEQDLKISVSSIKSKVTGVHLCYDYNPTRGDEYRPMRDADYIIRYILNHETARLRPIRLSNPHRAELEIQTFGRDALISRFTQQHVWSLPMKIFIDAFGLYRNMYRSILGVYALLAFLPDHIANRQSSVIPITLTPFASEDADTLSDIPGLAELDRGCHVTINGKPIFMCAFTMCFLGDMPQQAELSGCLRHNAIKCCRYCLIDKNSRSNLQYDIVNFGRYQPHMQSSREDAASMSNTAAKKFLRGLGLTENNTVCQAVCTFTPALDIIRSRPIDPAHGEFTSLVKNAHRILMDEILTAGALERFTSVFQQFRLPPGWKRLQSPRTHLDSWRMIECAEASIFTPVLLRCWLTPASVKPSYAHYIKAVAPRFLDVFEAGESAVNLIVTAFWNSALSNLMICSRTAFTKSRQEFTDILLRGRNSLQLLFHAAALSASKPKISNSTASAATFDDGFSEISGVSNISNLSIPDDFDVTKLSGRKKGPVYAKYKGLPNIHQGLHLWEVIREYGSGRNCFTLLGEAKHK